MDSASQGLPTHALLDLRTSTIIVNNLRIDVTLLAAICNPDKRILWRFVYVDGEVKAEPYTEEQVIWIDRSDLEDAETKG
jgi:hypothetical protein